MALGFSGRYDDENGVQSNLKMADENESPQICSENVSESESLTSIEGADIDIGRFKYVLIKLTDKKCSPKANKFIVRGYKWADFHADVYEKVEEEIIKQHPNIKCSCPGGGRILHDPGSKTISVFGYSQGYGKADHKISMAILKEKYPDYTIDSSDEGY